jgi:hypothetical protein
MVGDFNFGDHRPEYHVLTGLTGMRDTAVELDDLRSTVLRANPYRTKKTQQTKRTQRFSRVQKLGKRVDYVFVRDGSKAAFRPLSLDRVFDEPIELEGRPGAYSNHAGLLAEVEAFPAQIASSTLLNRQAVDLASKLLSEGRQEAERRRSDGRALAGMGMACAAAAAAGGRTEPVSRRRFLQKSLRVAAVAGLAPGIGYTVMSELVVPNELIAFDRAEESLGQLAQQHFAGDAERTS